MKRKWLWFLAVILLCTACGKAPQEQTGSQQASETEQVDTAEQLQTLQDVKAIQEYIDTVLEENVFKIILERIKEFFYS